MDISGKKRSSDQAFLCRDHLASKLPCTCGGRWNRHQCYQESVTNCEKIKEGRKIKYQSHHGTYTEAQWEPLTTEPGSIELSFSCSYWDNSWHSSSSSIFSIPSIDQFWMLEFLPTSEQLANTQHNRIKKTPVAQIEHNIWNHTKNPHTVRIIISTTHSRA